MRLALLLAVAVTLAACTGTNTEIRPIQQTPTLASSLRGETVAVLPFFGPNGPNAQDVVTRVLVGGAGVKLVSPSLVDNRLRVTGFRPSAYDVAALASLAKELNASRLIWGVVTQFTPYRFDRLAPATPAYVEMRIDIFSARSGDVSSALVNRQGALPLTIWDRQPTFDDVAFSAAADYFTSLR